MRLDKSKFIKWLNTKQPDEIVGHNHDCHSCPIAHFYYDASGGSDVVIYDSGGCYRIDRGYSITTPPRWVQWFVYTVDGEDNGKITAHRALEILRA